MKEIEILYDHYKKTFEVQIKYIDERNKYFLYLLGLISVLSFNSLYGVNFKDYLLRVLANEKVSQIDANIFETLLLYAITWLLILYFKKIITVDRGYKYLHKIEDELNKEFKTIKIIREGHFYKNHKTRFSKVTGKIYKWVFPISIMIACLIVYINGLMSNKYLLAIKIVNGVLVSIIMVLVITFMIRKRKKSIDLESK